jgi:hypothetical protein
VRHGKNPQETLAMAIIDAKGSCEKVFQGAPMSLSQNFDERWHSRNERNP